MRCEQCTFSLGPAEDSLPTSSSAMSQFALSSGMPTPAKCSESAPQTDGSPACTCTRAMCGCSIRRPGPAEWTAYMRGFLAKTLASPDVAQVLEKAQEAASTAKCCASLMWFDQTTYSWKTSQRSLIEDWTPYSETWPRAGLMLDGHVFELPTLARRSSAIVGGVLLPAPARSWSTRGPGISLTGRERYSAKSVALVRQIVRKIGWRWPATMLEMMMLWPTGYTGLRHWATVKFHCKRRSAGLPAAGR